MQSSSQGSSPGSSQEPKVHYTKQKNETDGNNAEIEEIDDTTQSNQDSCYSWSGISQEIDIKGEKRELSDDEKKPWWESFKSETIQKPTQETPRQKFHCLQASSQAQASSSQNDIKSDDEEEKKDDEKISFSLKLGKNKKIKYM